MKLARKAFNNEPIHRSEQSYPRKIICEIEQEPLKFGNCHSREPFSWMSKKGRTRNSWLPVEKQGFSIKRREFMRIAKLNMNIVPSRDST